jgi:hypothetical protein
MLSIEFCNITTVTQRQLIALLAYQDLSHLVYIVAFAFFADPRMQSFYKRFIRDYMRYKDYIQCIGHDMVKVVRADALKHNPAGNGEYYAMHIRRGDFQFKDVKISAQDIVRNLNFTGRDGKQLIPPGSFVYISTDDPDGLCKDCYVQRKPCTDYPSPKPEGCPEDVSSWLMSFCLDSRWFCSHLVWWAVDYV